MSLLSSEQLTQMRAQAAATFDQSCVISTPSAPIETAEGGTTPGTPSTATVLCRVATPAASDQRIAERLSVVVDTVITVPFGTNVASDASIILSTNGKSYKVTYGNTDQSYRTADRLLCRSIRGIS